MRVGGFGPLLAAEPLIQFADIRLDSVKSIAPCVKSGRSVRSFKGMGFADLATSACTAYLDCYGGDDRKAVKVHSYADDDDFFDDDLYAAMS